MVDSDERVEDFGQWVLARRSLLGISQAQLASAAGITQPNVSAIESGARVAGQAVRERIERALAATPSSLLSKTRERVLDVFTQYGQPAPKVFGSVARSQDTLDSDIDFMVEVNRPFLGKYKMIRDLEAVLTCRVDVVDANATPRIPRVAERFAKAKQEAVPV